jgi:hypothetical protein
MVFEEKNQIYNCSLWLHSDKYIEIYWIDLRMEYRDKFI